MKRISITEAQRDLSRLIRETCSVGDAVELEEDNKVVACLKAPEPAKRLTVCELNDLLRSLPSLGEDAATFAEDIDRIRRGFPAEVIGWD